MKLTKDQTQKIALGAMLLVGVVYGFIAFLIGPVSDAHAAADRDSAALDPKIAAAKGQIAKAESLRAKMPDAQKLLVQVGNMIPEGSPVAWFPPRITDYFKHQGIDKVSARPNTEVAEKELPGFKRLNWGVEIPRVEFAAFAKAVAEMENGEPLLEIQAIDIEGSRDEVIAQRANLTINNLVHQ